MTLSQSQVGSLEPEVKFENLMIQIKEFRQEYITSDIFTGESSFTLVLAIVFWIVGFVGGKLIWGNDNSENTNINSSQSISQENSSGTKRKSKHFQIEEN